MVLRGDYIHNKGHFGGGGGGLKIDTFLGPELHEPSECHLGPKKSMEKI